MVLGVVGSNPISLPIRIKRVVRLAFFVPKYLSKKIQIVVLRVVAVRRSDSNPISLPNRAKRVETQKESKKTKELYLLVVL